MISSSLGVRYFRSNILLPDSKSDPFCGSFSPFSVFQVPGAMIVEFYLQFFKDMNDYFLSFLSFFSF